MPDAPEPLCCNDTASNPEHLNQTCFCITLDHRDLAQALDMASGEPGLYDRIAASHAHLFSNVPVFLPATALQAMTDTVEAIDRLQRFQPSAMRCWIGHLRLPTPIMGRRVR